MVMAKPNKSKTRVGKIYGNSMLYQVHFVVKTLFDNCCKVKAIQ